MQRRLRLPRPGNGRVWRSLAFPLLLGALGALAGVLLAGRIQSRVGPFDATLSLRLDAGGDTVVRLAPLGTLRFDTHDGPVGLDVRADELRLAAAERLLADPAAIARLDQQISADTADALRGLLLRALAGGVVGAVALPALRGLTRPVLLSGSAAGLATLAVLGTSVTVTWDADAVLEPKFTGLLTAAPAAIGSVRDIEERYEQYRSQLTRLIGNVAGLYEAFSSLDTAPIDADTIRILHVSDLHLNPQGFDLISQLVRRFQVDGVVDSGDIVDWGTRLETSYTDAIGRLRVPYLYVRGNHDSAETAAAIGAQPNAVVLDGSSHEVAGLRIWGIGDPRFTPDKQASGDIESERRVAREFAGVVDERLNEERERPHVALVHDPAVASMLAGDVDLVLAGHLHRTRQRRLDKSDTLLLVEASTGGAGLRTLEGEKPVPLSCKVLYFDRATKRLIAYDQITVSGLGGTSASIERRTPPRPRSATITTTTGATTTSAAAP